MGNKSRIIPAILSSALLISTINNAVLADAAWVEHSRYTEEYYNEIEYYNENCLLLSDCIDYVNVMFKSNIKNIWLSNRTGDKEVVYFVEMSQNDGLRINTDAPESEADSNADDLAEKLGYPANVRVAESPTKSADVFIELEGDDHDLNEMIFEKAIDIVGKEHNIISAPVSMNKRVFSELHIYWNIMDQKVFQSMTRDELERIFAENSIKVKIDPETKHIYPLKDITLKELFEYGAFVTDRFGAEISSELLCSASNGYSLSADLLSVERSYLFGDANCDGNMNMADAVMIMQSIAAPDKYKMIPQGEFNADVANTGDGITNQDANAIQRKLLGLTD